LAISLVEKQKPEVYSKISKVYSEVKRIVEKECKVREGIGYSYKFFEDIPLDSLNARDLQLKLEEPFNQDITDDAAEGIHSIFDTVMYFLSGTKGGSDYAVIAKSSMQQITEIRDNVMKKVKSCFDGEVEAMGLSIPMIGYGKLNQSKLQQVLDKEFIHNTFQAEQLARRSLYEVIEFVAKRDIKL
jgi:acyl carrier protein